MSANRRDKSKSGPTQKRGKPDINLLPVHVAHGFEKELDALIVRLASTHGFKGRYLLSEYKSKYNDPTGVTPAQRRHAAIEKWFSTEDVNSKTNMRLQLGDTDFGWTTSDLLLKRARIYVSEVLGTLRYPEILSLKHGHTNGASSRVRKSPRAGIDKHTGEAHVSSSALKHWLRFASNSILSDQVLCINEHSVLDTVPKKTEIDRVICKEPEINMFLQRSVGAHIRKRLKRYGIDLNDQTVNQKLAMTALADKSATIDLSAASDSVTKQLVIELLPFDWWSLLNDLRVHHVNVDGSVHETEMFSSMGNGFTFELETLIFWALTRSIMYLSGVRGKLSVYGDDIIAPVAIAPRLARTFAWFGFKVNPKKSNWTGFFRESCGVHYYRNMDVSPFYIREPVRSKTDLIRLLNRLCEWDGRGFGFISDPDILSFHMKWSRIIPANLHGGQDLDDITSLVTGDGPRSRLKMKSRAVPYPQEAGYLFWLTKRESSHEGLTLDVTQETRYSIVPHSRWTVRTTWDPWIIHKIQQCDPIS